MTREELEVKLRLLGCTTMSTRENRFYAFDHSILIDCQDLAFSDKACWREYKTIDEFYSGLIEVINDTRRAKN